MAITPMSADLAIISALSDEPNDVTGLTPAQLKAKFDEAAALIKLYINETLLPNLTAANVGFSPTAGVPEAENAQAAIEAVQAQIVAMALGQIPDGTITRAKLAYALQAEIEGKAKAIRAAATIPTGGWTGTSGAYTCDVAIAGLLQTDAPHITRVLAHDSTDTAVQEAWDLVTDAEAIAGALRFYSQKLPQTSIPVSVEVVR